MQFGQQQPQGFPGAVHAGSAPGSLSMHSGIPRVDQVQTPTPARQTGGMGMSGARFTGAVSPMDTPGAETPIRSLTPYSQRWMIRARVTTKTDVRHFTNARGEGKLFSCDLVDADGGEIRATFFGKAVDINVDLLQPKGVYTFAKGTLKAANKQFTTLDHPYEITFDERSEVRVSEEGGANIPSVQFKLVPLPTLAQHPPQTSVDVAAVVVAVKEASTIMTRSGERARRNATLADESGTSVELTLWGSHANAELTEGTVLLARSLKISDFNGVSLNSTANTFLDLNPDHDRAFALTRWYQEQGRGAAFSSMSSGGSSGGVRKTLAEMKQEDDGLLPSGANMPQDNAPGAPRKVNSHLIVPATITQIPHDRPPFYMACPEAVPGFDGGTRACAKKAELTGDVWRCNNGHQCNEPLVRWQVSGVQISDASGSSKVDVLGDKGDAVFNCTAKEAADLWNRQQEDPNASAHVEAMFQRVMWRQVSLKLRSKKEVWNEQERTRSSVEQCTSVNAQALAVERLAEIRKVLQF